MKNYQTTRNPETGELEGIPHHAFVHSHVMASGVEPCKDCGHHEDASWHRVETGSHPVRKKKDEPDPQPG